MRTRGRLDVGATDAPDQDLPLIALICGVIFGARPTLNDDTEAGAGKRFRNIFARPIDNQNRVNIPENVSRVHGTQAQEYPCLAKGRVRMRSPVAVKMALQTAGRIGGRAGSPRPVLG